MSRYEGRRTKGGVIVTVNSEPLDPRFDLQNHSPSGFEWGYAGSGPAQLALAILADHLNDDTKALNLHQRFKWTVIVNLPERWTLSANEVERAVQSIIRMEKGS